MICHKEKKIFTKGVVLYNQENFLLQGNSYLVKKCLPDARIVFKKVVKNNLDGRPKNGMFIAILGKYNNK